MNDQKIERDSAEYNRLVQEILRSFGPTILPCKKCGAPVADGWCCAHCGDNNPSAELEKDLGKDLGKDSGKDKKEEDSEEKNSEATGHHPEQRRS